MKNEEKELKKLKSKLQSKDALIVSYQQKIQEQNAYIRYLEKSLVNSNNFRPHTATMEWS